METRSRRHRVVVFAFGRNAAIVGSGERAMKTDIFERTVGVGHLGKTSSFL
jgi:hypothetical protein